MCADLGFRVAASPGVGGRSSVRSGFAPAEQPTRGGSCGHPVDSATPDRAAAPGAAPDATGRPSSSSSALGTVW
jgi:hypothetical protein